MSGRGLERTKEGIHIVSFSVKKVKKEENKTKTVPSDYTWVKVISAHSEFLQLHQNPFRPLVSL